MTDFRSICGTNLLGLQAIFCGRINKEITEGGSPTAALLKVANLAAAERPALLICLDKGGSKLMALYGVSGYIPFLCATTASDEQTFGFAGEAR